MTIKNRIFISNTAIVLISLLILFGVFGAVFTTFEDEYTKELEQEYGLADQIYDVQTILMSEQETPGTWEQLSQKIGKYGFTLYVLDEDKEEQFSNTDSYELETIVELDSIAYTSSQVKLYRIEGGTLARCMITIKGSNYNVYAVYAEQGDSQWGMEKGMFEMFIIVFVITGIVVIAGLLFCSQVFTIKLIKKIMEPVEELNQAAQRIDDGILNMPIHYCKKDEFYEVCNTFNAMQENLKAGMEKNAAYEKARTEMISGISHDLRTPLTSVKGYVKGMLDGIANTPEKQKRYLEMSYQRACDMDELLQKLFFFSKLETGNMPFFTQCLEMSEWMENYIAAKQIEGEEKGYSIFLEKDNVDCFSNIDADQIQRVFDNLTENSLKYADATNLEIRVKIKKTDEKVKISFGDNGKGVEEEKLTHVFEQFYRGDESRNSKKDGSGLGLYVCKYIVEAHGGQIVAKNQDGFAIKMEFPLV